VDVVSKDLTRRVREALERTDIMALSTIGADGPWTAPVQYRYNEKLDLFFLSMPDTKHVRHILCDPRVSVAIYSHPGPPGGNLGLQISGTAEHLTGSPPLADGRVSRSRRGKSGASTHASSAENGNRYYSRCFTLSVQVSLVP